MKNSETRAKAFENRNFGGGSGPNRLRFRWPAEAPSLGAAPRVEASFPRRGLCNFGSGELLSKRSNLALAPPFALLPPFDAQQNCFGAVAGVDSLRAPTAPNSQPIFAASDTGFNHFFIQKLPLPKPPPGPRANPLCENAEPETRAEAAEKRVLRRGRPRKSKSGDSNEGSWTESNLKNLKAFLVKLFTYKRIFAGDLERLLPCERDILKDIIQAKNYVHREALARAVDGGAEDARLWIRFYKDKRKEEYHKYGFKLLIKILVRRFRRGALAILGRSVLRFADVGLLFYLFHFGHLEFEDSFEAVIARLRSRELQPKEVWKKLRKFVFPEVGFHVHPCETKSISKRFLRRVFRARNFAGELLALLTELTLFLGYCWDTRWADVPEERYSSMDSLGIALLRDIGAVNTAELGKLFTEWNNLVTKCVGRRCSNRRKMALVRSSVRRINFKFPWSFREVHEAVVHTFLSLAESVVFDHLPAKALRSLTRARVRSLPQLQLLPHLLPAQAALRALQAPLRQKRCLPRLLPGLAQRRSAHGAQALLCRVRGRAGQSAQPERRLRARGRDPGGDFPGEPTNLARTRQGAHGCPGKAGLAATEAPRGAARYSSAADQKF